jgi:hypothetical protein
LQADSYIEGLLQGNRNLLIPHYLMHSWLYYECDLAVVSDGLFDKLCRDLLAEFPTLTHTHKHLVDPTALTAGTGFYLSGKYPEIVKGAASALYWMFNPKKPPRRRRRPAP